jgi:UDP-N-acetylmuramoyl-tripeptide--D-alanyl-D-alanine ligase
VRFRASELASALGGTLDGDDVVADGVSTDSRALSPGQLFVPIVAERDGHDFVADALRAGAVAYVTSRPSIGGSAIVVDDTGRALYAVGAVARGRLPAPERVVGITGSVGKTTTKDLLANVMRERFVTGATLRNLNNELGVPLTLANAPDGAEALVVEMGARGLGHIRSLCVLVRPTVGLVTAVAGVHTELFGSIDEVAVGKRELIEALPASGTAVLNADDPRVAAMSAFTTAAVLRCSMAAAPDADVAATGIALDDDLRPSFTLHTPWGDAGATLEVRGVHQVANALMAAAAGLVCGVDLDAVVRGLGRPGESAGRMAVHRTASGAVVIDDTYNASPASMSAALRALAALPADRRVAVVGTMAELGATAVEDHLAIGALAISIGIDLIAVDEATYGVTLVDGIDGALRALGPLAPGDAVLVKASRSARLERVVERLLR